MTSQAAGTAPDVVLPMTKAAALFFAAVLFLAGCGSSPMVTTDLPAPAPGHWLGAQILQADVAGGFPLLVGRRSG